VVHALTKVTLFNSVDPCKEFVFESDVIEHVQTFKYLGILFKTTSNLDSVVEHLAATSRRSLFALNRRCAKLRIMDIKLRCDLFNTLVHSTASYAYEVWVDSKKLKVIEIVYRRFLKSLLRVRKTTSTSIVLAKFSKFPFEHLHGDKHYYITTVWARSLKTASWERHGQPSSLCLLQEKNVGLDPWKNGYSKINPERWQVFYLQFNQCYE